MVFEEPMNALNPVMRIGDQFVDAVQAHEKINRRRALARAGELLELVGIDARRVSSYPHQLSGGMRQRVMIAMALALEPELIILDEPTTALDVVVQREILQQVEALKRDFGFAVLFITHDLGVVRRFADRVAVMYAGEIVELADGRRALREPASPLQPRPVARSRPLRGPIEPLASIPGRPPDLADRLRTTSSRAVSGRRRLADAAVHASDRRGPGLKRSLARHGGGARCQRRDPRGSGLSETSPSKRAGKPYHIRAVDDVSFAGRGRRGSRRRRRGVRLRQDDRRGSRADPRRRAAGAGSAIYDGTDILDAARRRSSTPARMQMIFQDPYASLEPRQDRWRIIAEPSTATVRHLSTGTPSDQRSSDAAGPRRGIAGRQVPSTSSRAGSGSASRSLALALQPELIVRDEPISALDVSIEALVLNLVADLKARRV